MADLPSKYTTGIAKAEGTVIGEHNTIYQYFAQPQHARVADKHLGYQAFISSKTDRFVGRKFVFDTFDRFLTKNRSGYFLIFGEPGIGKSALAAQLVKTRGYPHHFNIAQQNIRTPRQFLSNACAQVIARYQLEHDSIPEDATEDSNFLVQCLHEAASKPENRPVVLVVDALDESERFNLPARANTLFLPPDLPDGVFIFLTSRPLDNPRLQVTNQASLYLEPDSDANLKDIRAYIENFVKSDQIALDRISKWGVSMQFFIDTLTGTLAKKSEGNFIYLYFILPVISQEGYRKDSVEELPQGLKGYYLSHWEQMQISGPVEFDELYAPVVCILAVAREPVTVSQLNKWTRKDANRIRRAIAQWRELLEIDKSSEEDRFRLYHTSFQDFLKQTVRLKQYDEIIVRYYTER